MLHIIASVDPRSGGPIEGILRQDEAVREIGRREIVSLDPPDSPFLEGYPIKVHPLGAGRYDPHISTKKIKRFGFSSKFVPWLRQHVGDYDCVVVNGLWNYASVGAARVLPKLSTPYFVFTHGMLDPWFRKRKPLTHVMKQALWLPFEGRLLRHARAVLFTTEEERELARGEFWGHPPYREVVVGYGAGDVSGEPEQQIAAFRAAVSALGHRPYLLYLSRIHEKKGCDLLVRAFARAAASRPDLDLVIAGPDQSGWVAKLQQIARDLGVESRIHWPGMLTGDVKWGAFRGAEAFILPSHQENFGIVVAEALACGTPTLISNKVNIWREVDAAGAGIVASDDQSGVDGLVERFLTLDANVRRRMRGAARTCFEANFNVKTSALTVLNTMATLS
jgi:glycosyltransferase involved in cell wall biosynthesis